MNLALITRPLRILLLAALIVGGLAGWFALLTQDGTENVAQAVAQFFLGLGVVLPATLIGYTRIVEVISDRQILLVIGVISGIVGVIAYMTIATLLAGSVGGEDLNQVRVAIGMQIPIWQMIVVVVVQIAVALIMPIEEIQE